MNEEQDIAGRGQQTIAAAFLFAVSAWVAFVSFNVDDPIPYLFPQLIAIVMLFLSGYALLRAIRGANRTGTGISLTELGQIAPALIIMMLYVFVLAPILGFYVGASIAFLSIYTFYDPQPHTSPMTWIIRLGITAGFIAVIYVVFAKGLQVQTPRGLFL